MYVLEKTKPSTRNVSDKDYNNNNIINDKAN